jgi:D-psicose/D-tagatose/L-ribulose 3-epimerase
LGYGISTCLAPELARGTFLAKLAAAGFRELELSAEAESLGGWLAHPAGARREIQAAGLRVRSVHTPEAGWDNGSLDPEKRRASAQAAGACLRPAAEVGAEVVVWHPNSSANDYTPALFGQYRAAAVESMAEFAGKARAAGLRVAVENLPRRGTPRPLTSVAELLPCVSALGAGVGICLDAGHSNANGLSAAAEARAAGASLLAVHIQDNDGGGQDQHLLPGKGTTDWPAFVRALDEIGYAGGRIFELGAPAGDVDAALAAFAELVRAWGA